MSHAGGSKKNNHAHEARRRSCQFCRRRKIKCIIEDGFKDCNACVQRSQLCYFAAKGTNDEFWEPPQDPVDLVALAADRAGHPALNKSRSSSIAPAAEYYMNASKRSNSSASLEYGQLNSSTGPLRASIAGTAYRPPSAARAHPYTPHHLFSAPLTARSLSAPLIPTYGSMPGNFLPPQGTPSWGGESYSQDSGFGEARQMSTLPLQLTNNNAYNSQPYYADTSAQSQPAPQNMSNVRGTSYQQIHLQSLDAHQGAPPLGNTHQQLLQASSIWPSLPPISAPSTSAYGFPLPFSRPYEGMQYPQQFQVYSNSSTALQPQPPQWNVPPIYNGNGNSINSSNNLVQTQSAHTSRSPESLQVQSQTQSTTPMSSPQEEQKPIMHQIQSMPISNSGILQSHPVVWQNVSASLSAQCAQTQLPPPITSTSSPNNHASSQIPSQVYTQSPQAEAAGSESGESSDTSQVSQQQEGE